MGVAATALWEALTLVTICGQVTSHGHSPNLQRDSGGRNFHEVNWASACRG
jgi:hypothetical protein